LSSWRLCSPKSRTRTANPFQNIAPKRPVRGNASSSINACSDWATLNPPIWTKFLSDFFIFSAKKCQLLVSRKRFQISISLALVSAEVRPRTRAMARSSNLPSKIRVVMVLGERLALAGHRPGSLTIRESQAATACRLTMGSSLTDTSLAHRGSIDVQ
jgi:hypothetical protein